MQGRLSEIVNGKIQSFPWDEWEQEFSRASKIGISTMEWTLDHEKIFLRNQQSVIHYYVGSLSRFDITENIYNDKLEVVYGTNYSLYKLK